MIETKTLEERQREFAEWAATRPEKVRAVALAYPPTQLYRHRVTGQTCSITSYSEPDDDTQPVTLRMRAWHEDAEFWTTVDVFGVDPSDLTPGPIDVYRV